MKNKFIMLIIFLLAGCSYVESSQSDESVTLSEESVTLQNSDSHSSSSQDDSSITDNESISSDYSSSDESESLSSEISESTSSEDVSSSEEITTKVQSFYHKFEKTDFSNNGGKVAINGLTFNYSAFTYLGGAAQGVQIGSKKNPQKTLWELTTSFDEEVIITSFYVELSNASGGSGTYSYSFSDYEVKNPFSTPQVLTKHGEEDLYVPTTDLTFSLLANSAAMYLYSISFSCITSIDSKLNITQDKYDATPVTPGSNSIPNVNYTTITKEDYYKDIDLTANKEALLPALRNQISTMTKVSYGDAKTMLQYTDEHPNNKGYLYGLFDGDLIPAKWDQGASWNREHVWACAHMKITGDSRPSDSTKNHMTDLHNLRAACQLSNGKHGDLYYDEKTNGAAFYPNIIDGLTGHHAYAGDFRGDVARILFYMYVRYDGLKLTSNTSQIDSVTMGNLDVLLTWNTLDPVDEFEVQRNNRIYQYQGNRNPFIDYSNLADIIFK